MTLDTNGQPLGDAPQQDTGANAAPERNAASPGAADEKSEEPKSEVSAQPLPQDYHKLLHGACELLDYAAEAGIAIDLTIAKPIIAARNKKALTDEQTLTVLDAVTKLAAKMKPVTAETLKHCRKDAGKALSNYFYSALVLGFFLIVASVATFVVGSISKTIETEIGSANQLIVALDGQNTDNLAPGKEEMSIANQATLAMLQQFAATTREIYARAQQLRYIVPDGGLTFDELASGCAPTTCPQKRPLELVAPATYEQIRTKIVQFQMVRAFATDLKETTTVIFGAITNCLLPSFYAILGALAYLLKTFSEQIRGRAYMPSADADNARFIIAAIGGGVVGLFSNFTLSQGTSLSILGVAFLIGYGTEVFFAFLDGLEVAFTKPKTG